jgi:membrane-associated protease RseP (regulator of RpoE activity)
MSALGVLLFVVFILFAIGLHEFGHFATAKAFGIKVERFFIGFGPKIWSTRRGETEYGVAVLPFGGYVRIAGMNPYEEVAPEDRARTFKAKPAWQRAIVLVAGSFTHFLIAFVMAAALLAFVGLPTRATNAVEEVGAGQPGQRTPAQAAGFRPGDRIVGVGEAPVSSWDQVRAFIREHPGRTVVFVIERRGERLALSATLADHKPNGERVGFLGISPRLENQTLSFPQAIARAGRMVGTGTKDSFTGLGRVFSPAAIGRLLSVAAGDQMRRLDDPSSIVGVGRAAGDLAGRGRFASLLFIVVGFNIFVGVANLLPLPPLDGGHLAVLAYEQVRRREVDMRKLMPVSAFVVTILVSLFVLLLYLDIVRPLPPIPG